MMVRLAERGDRLQSGLRGEGAPLEPAHHLGAHLVRPGDHPTGHGSGRPVRRRVGGPARDPQGPGARGRAFAHLALEHPDEPWTLEIIGSGALRPALEQQIAALPAAVADRITLQGRLAPPDVAAARERSGVFLMTSHAGYEGFPGCWWRPWPPGCPPS